MKSTHAKTKPRRKWHCFFVLWLFLILYFFEAQKPVGNAAGRVQKIHWKNLKVTFQENDLKWWIPSDHHKWSVSFCIFEDSDNFCKFLGFITQVFTLKMVNVCICRWVFWFFGAKIQCCKMIHFELFLNAVNFSI